MRVYKYVIQPGDYHPRIEMPIGAELLHLAMQGEQLCLWALVDPAAPPITRTFRILATGDTIVEHESRVTHIGTVLMAEGRLVFHVFEIDR